MKAAAANPTQLLSAEQKLKIILEEPAKIKIPIKIIPAQQLAGDTGEKFYALSQGKPIIVRDLYKQNEFLNDITLDTIAKAFENSTIRGYHLKKKKHVSIPSKAVFEDVLKPTHERQYSVVDHPINHNATFNKWFTVPSFFTENWFESHPIGVKYVKSISMGGTNNWTPMHTDPWGMQGWMFLAVGKKYWEMVDLQEIPLVFDTVTKDFYNPLSPEASTPQYQARFPLRSMATKYVGTLEAGDLMFIPPGWVHHVFTYEPSFGIGGAVFNRFLLHQSVRLWLHDKSLTQNDKAISLLDILKDLKEKEEVRGEVEAQVSDAVKEIEAWEESFADAQEQAAESDNDSSDLDSDFEPDHTLKKKATEANGKDDEGEEGAEQEEGGNDSPKRRKM